MAYLELKVPPPIVAAFVLLSMYLSKDLLPNYGISNNISWSIAAVLLLLGISIGILSVVQFRLAKTTISPTCPQQTLNLVDNGLLSFSRNPMYLGLVICITAVGIALQHWGVIGFVAFSIVYLQRFQIIPEENILTEKFGESYINYCKRVARWL